MKNYKNDDISKKKTKKTLKLWSQKAKHIECFVSKAKWGVDKNRADDLLT